MSLFGKRKKEKDGFSSVKEGDLFVKNDKVESFFVVDAILDFSPVPAHVRLKEQGGNERTLTVAMDTLLDERYWHKKTNTEL